MNIRNNGIKEEWINEWKKKKNKNIEANKKGKKKKGLREKTSRGDTI